MSEAQLRGAPPESGWEGGSPGVAGAPSLLSPALPAIPPEPQVIETRKKEAPYMLPEDVFVERPR